jgi:hypothetical protein
MSPFAFLAQPLGKSREGCLLVQLLCSDHGFHAPQNNAGV